MPELTPAALLAHLHMSQDDFEDAVLPNLRHIHPNRCHAWLMGSITTDQLTTDERAELEALMTPQ